MNKQELIEKEESSVVTLMFLAEWLAQLLMRSAVMGKDKHKWWWESLKRRLAGEPSVSGKEYFISDLVEHCLHMVTIKRKWFLFGLKCLLIIIIFFNISYQSHSTTVFSIPGGACSHPGPPPCRMVKGRREILWDPFWALQHPKCL